MGAEKPYMFMDQGELRDALHAWEGRVENAGGWSSAYFAAKQVEAICREGKRRDLDGFENRYPIRHDPAPADPLQPQEPHS